MHRGPNPDYDPRDPASPPRYGPPGALGSGSAFPGPFNRPAFPPRFPNPVSYPTSVPPPGFQSFSTEPPYQVTGMKGLRAGRYRTLYRGFRYRHSVQLHSELCSYSRTRFIKPACCIITLSVHFTTRSHFNTHHTHQRTAPRIWSIQ